MQRQNLTAKSVGLEYTKTVPIHEITERVMRGEAIVLPKCMQAIGYFDKLNEASLEGIRQAIGEEKAALVREEGFEAIHKIIDLDKLTSIVRHTYKSFLSLAPELSRIVVRKVFKTRAFYFEEEPNVRFHIPYDVAVRRKEELCNFYWNGKITAHCPHHDSWYDCPANSINIWIAIGPVKVGNGLSLYPQVYGKRLPCTEDGKILRNQYFGRALNFELEPGDAVVFHGEHLHSSEINSTSETRHVVSLRITLEKPKFLTKSPDNFIRSQSGLVGRFSEKLMKLTKAERLVNSINSAFSRPETGDCLRQWASPNRTPGFNDTAADFPQLLSVRNSEEKLTIDSSDLEIGKIRPISPKLCAARLDQHRTVVFSRSCPHEGADLAAGYLRDGCIVCPWHNLPFSTENGASPCKSLPQLTVFEYIDDQEDRGGAKEENLTPSLQKEIR